MTPLIGDPGPMTGLLGTSPQAPGGLMSGMSAFNQANPGLAYQMGPLSQLAYQMAGSPHYGPYASVPVPAGSTSGLGGTTATTAGGGIGGLLGSIATNPSLAKNIGNAVSGLLGPSAVDTAAGGGEEAAIGSALGSAAPVAGAADTAAGGGELAALQGALGGAPAAASAAPAAGATASTGADAGLGLLGSIGTVAGLTGATWGIPALLGSLTANQGEGPVTLMNEALGQSPTLGAQQNAPGLLNPLTMQPFPNPTYQLGQQMQAAGQAGNTAAWNRAYNDLMAQGGGVTGGITQMR